MLDPGSGLAKEYLRLLVDEIRVEGTQVIMRGSYANLAKAVSQKNPGTLEGVPGFGYAWLPICASTRTRPWALEPEVYFRIVHLAQNVKNCACAVTYCEQMVEITLGLKGAFENGNIGTLRRRAPPDQVLSAVPPGRGNPKQPREPPQDAPGGRTPSQSHRVASSPGIRKGRPPSRHRPLGKR
jgi:hypothetical protein